ncbi:hypothetical protein [Halohasta litorea]|uniref:Uncharacterized protein n=1 Tax=Halohasta litorea TaxID=869891 RepID=A0ABD6D4Y2_9EURY|nr:hypothetical protein [Halohasta litorea]
MVPETLVRIGVLLVAIPVLLALLSAAWLWVPLGLFVLVVGILLSLFKKHHENRLDGRVS